MSSELLPRIFDLFVQASAHGEQHRGGLGIGLSVSRTLAGMHGGMLEARSAGRHKGSEFQFCIPLATALRGETDARRSKATPARMPRSIRIVDDNDDATESLAMILSDHQVRTAASGEEGLAIAAATEPGWSYSILVCLELAATRSPGA
ncbi:ATP-binding protein [Paraburkholderia sp. RL18-085-BIA-A]|uniref:ATP-binding protein n=1 Tax=Paraburkholderia sp. RL18-085-BIA-A TaxID=3031633 RepID=UPI0038BC0160